MPIMEIGVKGYSALELTFALAVGAVVFSLAVPALAKFVERSAVVAAHNDLRGSIGYARNQAIQLSTPVSICASADQQRCGNGSDWNQGWIAFIDRGAPGELDGADEVLRSWSAPSQPRLAITPRDGRGTLRFSARGSTLPAGAATGWQLQPADCAAGADTRHEIHVGPSGDVRLKRTRCT
jgi:type IV fimbrial biogenesis protein FimT